MVARLGHGVEDCYERTTKRRSMARTLLSRRWWRSSPENCALRKASTISQRQRRADDARAEAQHVHVVVFDGLMRGVGVVADRRADARELVGGNRDAGAAAADDDAALGLAVRTASAPRLRPSPDSPPGPSNGCRDRGRRGPAASVVPPVRCFSSISGVIGAEGDSHESHRVHRPNPWLRRQMKRGGVYFRHAKYR